MLQSIKNHSASSRIEKSIPERICRVDDALRVGVARPSKTGVAVLEGPTRTLEDAGGPGALAGRGRPERGEEPQHGRCASRQRADSAGLRNATGLVSWQAESGQRGAKDRDGPGRCAGRQRAARA